MLRLTIPHHFDFGEDREEVGDELASPQSWDGLRVHTTGPFSLSRDRQAWLAEGDRHLEHRDRADAVLGVAHERGARSIASYGAGSGLLELWLRRQAPQMPLTVTEYAPETLGRLRSFFGDDATLTGHDLRAEGPVDADVHVFHRIDTEFSNRELRAIMDRFRESTVLLLATAVLGFDELLAELRQLRNPSAVPAGVHRNRRAFESLWKRTHSGERHRFGDLDGWVLTPRGR